MTQTREQLLAARDAIDAQIKALDAEPERAEEEVLPCPFCGGKAVWREYDERYPSDAYGLIVDHAQDCFLSFHRSFDIGRKAWGERATLSRVPAAAWPGEGAVKAMGGAITAIDDLLFALRFERVDDRHPTTIKLARQRVDALRAHMAGASS